MGKKQDLKIIAGLAGTGKTTMCLTEVAALCREEPLGAPLYIIVPEQASFEVEKKLALECGGGFLRAEVSGFKRLAYKLLAAAGKTRRSISDTARQIIIRRIIQQRRTELRAFEKAADSTAFAAESAALFRELKNDAVSPEKFATAAGSDKLHDLALLFSDWEEYKTRNMIMDPEDYLDEIAGILEMPALAGARFWFDGFNFFSGTEHRLIAGLLARHFQVTVTLCLDNPDTDYSDAGEMLHRPWLTFKKLVGGRTAEVEILTEAQRFKSGEIFAVGEILHNAAGTVKLPDNNAVEIVEAANISEECDYIARSIVNMVRQAEGGLRWRDIALAGGNVEEYRTILTAALEAAAVPYAFDTPQALSRHILNDFVRAVLEVRVTGFSYNAVFQALKTGLATCISVEETDLLENYCLRYGIKGWHWRSGHEWDFSRREQNFQASDAPLFDDAGIDALRRKVVDMFSGVTGCAATAPLGEYIAGLEQVLDKAGAAAVLEEFAAKQDSRLDAALAAMHHTAWNNLQKLLDELKTLCGQDIMPIADFSRLLAAGLESSVNKLPPPGMDYVSVCSLERMKMPERRCLLLFGINDGAVPSMARGSQLLSDGEIELLNNSGVSYGTSAERIFSGRLLFYCAILQATERLIISYAASDNSGKSRSASIFVNNILRKSGLTCIRVADYAVKRRTAASGIPVISDYLLNWRVSESLLASVYSSSLEAGADAGWWRVLLNRMVKERGSFLYRAERFRKNPERISAIKARELYLTNGAFNASISRLEMFISCPFRFFAAYGLKLQPRAEQEVNILDIGNIYHQLLEKIGSSLAGFDDVQLKELCRTVFEEEKRKFKSDYFMQSAYNMQFAERLYGRLEKAVLRFARFNRDSGSKPAFFEKKFGDGAGWRALEIAAGADKVLVRGVIDRIDKVSSADGERLLLIDYKQSGRDINWSKLYYGLSLQLPVYVAALRHNLPDQNIGGVMYMGLDDDRVTAGAAATADNIAKKAAERVKFHGLISGSVLPAVSSNAGTASVCTDAELDGMAMYSTVKAGEASCRIMDGEIEVRPQTADGNSPCDYCEYGELCQFERSLGDSCRMLKRVGREEVMNIATEKTE